MTDTSRKIVIGLVGRIASGKGTVAQYLQQSQGATVITFSQSLKDVLNRVHLPIDRDHLVRMSEVLREGFGEDLLSKIVVADAEAADTSWVVVDGARRPADVIHLSELPNFMLIEVVADPRRRHARLIERSEKVDDKAKTYEQFLADEQRSTEVSIDDLVSQANRRIDNNGTVADLYHQLDELILELAETGRG